MPFQKSWNCVSTSGWEVVAMEVSPTMGVPSWARSAYCRKLPGSSQASAQPCPVHWICGKVLPGLPIGSTTSLPSGVPSGATRKKASPLPLLRGQRRPKLSPEKAIATPE